MTGAVQIPFDNSYAALPEAFYTKLAPEPAPAPRLIAYNDALGAELGIAKGDDSALAAIFSGTALAGGSEPLAQLYAGHQFGQFNPQLGDGRAHLLGEVIDLNGIRRDIQLKGSGPTPYSRMGDGRAWMGPVLREYVVSEAMAALGIPTTRALAAVATGAPVYREEGALPGAVLTRVAQSHLRVGTFQIFAHRGQVDHLKHLTDYAIARHAPNADGPMGLLQSVCEKQAELVAGWLALGFIHGVMNTDNCTISGETIDYGPCAYLDIYHPGRVFSSIDRQGRYAYGNQPRILVWNMAQLATALIAQMEAQEDAIEAATAIVHALPEQIEAAWLRRFGAKLGIEAPQSEDAALIEDLLTRMAANQADFTNTFRALASGDARDQFADPEAFDTWAPRWRSRIASETDPEARMRAANPALIPRNHRIEQMIEHAVAGDMDPFERLLTALATPFDDPGDFADLARAPTPEEIVPATFCGT